MLVFTALLVPVCPLRAILGDFRLRVSRGGISAVWSIPVFSSSRRSYLSAASLSVLGTLRFVVVATLCPLFAFVALLSYSLLLFVLRVCLATHISLVCSHRLLSLFCVSHPGVVHAPQSSSVASHWSPLVGRLPTRSLVVFGALCTCALVTVGCVLWCVDWTLPAFLLVLPAFGLERLIARVVAVRMRSPFSCWFAQRCGGLHSLLAVPGGS